MGAELIGISSSAIVGEVFDGVLTNSGKHSQRPHCL
jgi:hypothetical protein